MSTRIYGIRHHGSGSARSLLQALEAQQPDCLLVEHPADTNAALQQIATPGLTPPVALLVYDPKAFHRAYYYPFARFSPEWQALQWATERGVPVWPMDLPAGMQLLHQEENAREPLLVQEAADEEALQMERDPFASLAALAGYADSERWWESVLEQSAAGSEVFEVITDMMRTLREATAGRESALTLLREAFMRKTIRQAHDTGFRNMAVVCGAWHGPALEGWQSIKAAKDNALLRGRKKVAVQAAWVPWTYERLAFESGYGAGVLSPAWYELLFDQPAETLYRWMVRAAGLLRQEDIDISTAHVMDAARLAGALAAMRRRSVPGIEDMEEAAATVFFQGNREVFQLIRKRLIIGENIGTVPGSLPAAPLLRDLEQEIRSARLSKEYASLEELVKELDLRTDTQLRASRLLHRLLLLAVPWGAVQERTGAGIGTFKEIWRLKWLPDYTLRLLQAGQWGNTVESAALHCALDRSRRSDELPVLANLAAEVLRAGLDEALAPLILRLEATAALARDVYLLMDALPGLVAIARYGSVRRTDAGAVLQLIRHIIPRIAPALPVACMQIEEEPADELFGKVLETNRNVLLLGEAPLLQYWQQALRHIAEAVGIHPLLQGGATRLLFDRNMLSQDETGRLFSLALSVGNEPLFSARWIEGFLHGSGLLLLHYPPLWDLIDDWVSGLEQERFREVLPLLRRTFSAFPGPERQKMLALAQQSGRSAATDSVGALDEGRLAIIRPTLELLLKTPLAPKN
ncbi:MAG: hypothetical protein KF852_09935 [Saprospiraceae bacterium]|nr:hypothetical protein [Saprospiraceae bacterium]